MTTRQSTPLLTQPEDLPRSLRSRALVAGWAAIQWPWLLRSLYGGSEADKQALLRRLSLPDDALPNLGSWKADTAFLSRIVDTIEKLQPFDVVELGCGATSLVIAKALEQNGGGRLTSFDQNAAFLDATGQCSRIMACVPRCAMPRLFRKRRAGPRRGMISIPFPRPSICW